MPWQDAMRMLIPIADALGYAHKHDIIHRDVKTANILITENGQPMLTNFGVAKMLDVEETMELTGTGVGIGTPEYMALEREYICIQPDWGATHNLKIGIWEWVTGGPLTYINWDKGTFRENIYAQLHQNLRWTGEPVDSETYFTCEWETASL